MSSILQIFGFWRFVRARSRPYCRVFGRPVAHFVAIFALFLMETLPKPQNPEKASKISEFCKFLDFSWKFQSLGGFVKFFNVFFAFCKIFEAQRWKKCLKSGQKSENLRKKSEKRTKSAKSGVYWTWCVLCNAGYLFFDLAAAVIIQELRLLPPTL